MLKEISKCFTRLVMYHLIVTIKTNIALIAICITGCVIIICSFNKVGLTLKTWSSIFIIIYLSIKYKTI